MSTSKDFIDLCRKEGKLSIDQALEIAENIGLFDDINSEIVLENVKKQKIRQLLGRVTSDGERTMRSVRLISGRVYIDLHNAANLFEINALIKAENERIAKSKRIINSLKKAKRMIIDGQISLDEWLADAL